MNIVLDAMGVIYRAGDDFGELLTPFLRSKGCALPDAEILSLYIECSLGKFSSESYWNQLGFHEDIQELENEYLQGHWLVHGLIEFLEQANTNGFPVHVISNDVSEWSRKLRKQFGLEKMIIHWCISGDVGARKPDEAIFTSFLKATGLNPQDCVFVDDREKNLETAKESASRLSCSGPAQTQAQA